MSELRVEPDRPTGIKIPPIRLEPVSGEEANRLRVEIQYLEKKVRNRDQDLEEAKERALKAIEWIQQRRTDLAILQLTDLLRNL